MKKLMRFYTQYTNPPYYPRIVCFFDLCVKKFIERFFISFPQFVLLFLFS